jgi:hypothetical protein
MKYATGYLGLPAIKAAIGDLPNTLYEYEVKGI